MPHPADTIEYHPVFGIINTGPDPIDRAIAGAISLGGKPSSIAVNQAELLKELMAIGSGAPVAPADPEPARRGPAPEPYESFTGPIKPGKNLTLLESGSYRDEHDRIWRPIDGGENYQCDCYIWPRSRFEPSKHEREVQVEYNADYGQTIREVAAAEKKLADAEASGAASSIIVTLTFQVERLREKRTRLLREDMARTPEERAARWRVEEARAYRKTEEGNKAFNESRRKGDKANRDLSHLTQKQKEARRMKQTTIKTWARRNRKSGRLSEEEIAAEVARREANLDIEYRQIVMAAATGDMSAAISA